MSLSKLSNKWIVFLSLIGGGGVLAWYIQKCRNDKRVKEREEKLRQIIDRQLVFGRPCSTTVVVNSLDDWSKIEDSFLQRIASTRLMGLDCEWLSEGKSTGKVTYPH